MHDLKFIAKSTRRDILEFHLDFKLIYLAKLNLNIFYKSLFILSFIKNTIYILFYSSYKIYI